MLVPERMTRVSISGADVIYMPGEIFVETAKAIREARRDDRLTVVVSGPTADVGYLSTPTAHREGGMEPHYAGVDVDGETLIRAAACELL